MKKTNIDPDKAIVITDPDTAGIRMFDYLTDIEKAKSGKTISKSGKFPADNVRVYVPININADSILYEVNQVYDRLGLPDGYNDFSFFEEMRKIYRKLDIYDEVLMERYPEKVIHYHVENSDFSHSENVIQVVNEMIQIMEDNEGCGELFPYGAINALRDDYFLDE